MPKQKAPLDHLSIAVAACIFELAPAADGVVPAEAHLLPAGFFRATDGRPESCAAWYINAQTAPQIIARMAARTNDTLIDYEHQSLSCEDNGQPCIAAGWFKTMDYRDNGLFAIDVRWTEKAMAYIAAKEIRYISSVFTYIRDTGEVLDIISACLTNSPGIDGLDALTKLNKRFTPLNSTGTIMPDPNTELAALTTERDSLKTQVTALTADKAALTQKLTDLEAATVAKALEDEKSQCTLLIKDALTSGRVLPAHKAYLEKKNLADLTDYLNQVAGMPMAVLTQQHNHETNTGTAALTQLERDMCDKTGVSHDEFLKAKGVN